VCELTGMREMFLFSLELKQKFSFLYKKKDFCAEFLVLQKFSQKFSICDADPDTGAN
jgi:hypothetical protein